MSKKIDTYGKLLAEKQKLEILFAAQKELVRFELAEMKEDLDPALYALQFIKDLTIRNKNNPVLQTGINLLVDLLADKLTSPDAGFLRKTVVPWILKNYASQFTEEAYEFFIEKLAAFFNAEKAEASE